MHRGGRVSAPAMKVPAAETCAADASEEVEQLAEASNTPQKSYHSDQNDCENLHMGQTRQTPKVSKKS
eukprot:5941912-Amphidinium_carterae.1